MESVFFSPVVKRLLITCVAVITFMHAHADAGVLKISGLISGYTGSEAFLAMMYGNQYVVDTAQAVNGGFVFESNYKLQSGSISGGPAAGKQFPDPGGSGHSSIQF